MTTKANPRVDNSYTSGMAQLQRDLAAAGRPLASWAVGAEQARLLKGSDSLWLVCGPEEAPFLALRAAYFADTEFVISKGWAANNGPMKIASLLGEFRLSLECQMYGFPTIRVRSWFTPRENLLGTDWPRDLFPIGPGGDPSRSKGRVEAAQRGMNSGVMFLALDEPERDLLYWQDYTSLARYFEDSGTVPDSAVGGHWPELGFQLPEVDKKTQSEPKALKAGEEYQIADTLLVICERQSGDEQDMAHSFIRLLSHVYDRIQRPGPEFRDWRKLADKTLVDLAGAPTASVSHYGFRYARPYNDAEYPDVMCQCTLASSVSDYSEWKGESMPFLETATAGLRKFYDRELGTLRRYLPNVGDDKDEDAVDSWYLYHPLLNLGRLARHGHRRARRLLLDSLDYGIKTARHFDYNWPIQFKVDSYDIITRDRGDGSGQTDVGGLYAYVMLQAFEITNDKRYVDEARTAIDAAKGMRFELNYQANLTAWGAAACLRLWRITGEDTHLRQSYVYLASFFHNCALWESEIAHARHYPNFLGVTALHDAPYMAEFECMDSFAAFEEFLRDTGPDVDQSAIKLVTEYCKYALDRAWFYYPRNLPVEAVAKENIRNGYIDRKLAFPLEDLYIDGQPAGQVGQEIYGAGAALIFASRCFHQPPEVPFSFFCDHFLMSLERRSATALELTPIGVEGYPARLRLMPAGRKKMPALEAIGVDGPIEPVEVEDGRFLAFDISSYGQTIVQWK